MNWLVFEARPPRWNAKNNRLSYGTVFITVFKSANIFEQRNCPGSLTISWYCCILLYFTRLLIYIFI